METILEIAGVLFLFLIPAIWYVALEKRAAKEMARRERLRKLSSEDFNFEA